MGGDRIPRTLGSFPRGETSKSRQSAGTSHRYCLLLCPAHLGDLAAEMVVPQAPVAEPALQCKWQAFEVGQAASLPFRNLGQGIVGAPTLGLPVSSAPFIEHPGSKEVTFSSKGNPATPQDMQT